MTAVEFHFNVPDRLGYACRLLRKAVRHGVGVAVTASPETLARLDAQLWRFDPVEFVPHLRLRRGETVPPRLHATPLWLVESAEQAAHLPVLVNLGDEPPEGYERHARVIEIVSADEAERARGRARWKRYAAAGCEIKRHEVAA